MNRALRLRSLYAEIAKELDVQVSLVGWLLCFYLMLLKCISIYHVNDM